VTSEGNLLTASRPRWGRGCSTGRARDGSEFFSNKAGEDAVIAWVSACVLLWLTLLALRTWVYGVAFTTDAVVIQGIRRWTIPLAAVREVSTRKWWGTKQIIVAGQTGPVRLPVPNTGPFTFDAAFDAKARAIKDWATSGRIEPS
jgi:hypothetical protein